MSEDQLRLLVAGAQKSGGIEAQEGQMINQVLNMQEKRVSEAMCPRVDVEALDKRATLHQLQARRGGPARHTTPPRSHSVRSV